EVHKMLFIKPQITFFFALAFSIFLISSCNESVNSNSDETNYDLKENLTLTDGQKQFSSSLVSIGVVEADVNKIKNKTNINFLTHNAIALNSFNESKSNLHFYIDNEVLYQEGKPNIGVTIIN